VKLAQSKLNALRMYDPEDFDIWPKHRQKAWRSIGRNGDTYFQSFTAPGIVPAGKSYSWSVEEDESLITACSKCPDLRANGKWGLFALIRCPMFTGKEVYDRWYKVTKARREAKEYTEKLRKSQDAANDRQFTTGLNNLLEI
jgi:hypothetical protein